MGESASKHPFGKEPFIQLAGLGHVEEFDRVHAICRRVPAAEDLRHAALPDSPNEVEAGREVNFFNLGLLFKELLEKCEHDWGPSGRSNR